MRLKPLHYAITLLVISTALLHFGAALDRQLFPDGPDPLFLLNGLGYLGLVAAYFLPVEVFQRRHGAAWWALFVYVIVTIIAWLVIWVGMNVVANGVPFFSMDSIYGVPSKIIEVVLLWLLLRDKP